MAQTRPTSSANSGQNDITENGRGRRLRNLGPIPPEALENVRIILGIESLHVTHNAGLLTRLTVEHVIDLHLTRAQFLITSEPERLTLARKTVSDAYNIAHAIPDMYLQAKCLFWEAVVDVHEGHHEDAALGFYYAFVNFAPFWTRQRSFDIEELSTLEDLCIEMCLLSKYLAKYRKYIVQFIDSEVVQDRGRAREMLGFIDQSIRRSSDKSTNQVSKRVASRVDDKPTDRIINRLRNQNRTRPLSEVSDQFERLMHEVCRPIEPLTEPLQPTTPMDDEEVTPEVIPNVSSQEFQPMDDIMPILQAGMPRARIPREPIKGPNRPNTSSSDTVSSRVNQSSGERRWPTLASTQGGSPMRPRSNSSSTVDRQRPSLLSRQNMSQEVRDSIRTAPLLPDAIWSGSPKSQPLPQEVAKEVELSDALTPEKLGTRVHTLGGRRASLPVSLSVRTDSSDSDTDIGRNLTYSRDPTKPSISSPLRTVFLASEDVLEEVPESALVTDASTTEALPGNIRGDDGFGN